MIVDAKVNVKLYSDSAKKDKLYGPDDDAALVSRSAHNEWTGNRFSLPGAGVYVIPLGSVAAPRGIFIRALGDFDLVLNAGSTIQVRKPTGESASVYAKIYLDMVLTSAQITNASATVALVGEFAIWGD